MNKKRVIIQTVGGSPAPLIKSLIEKKPNYVYFIPSNDTIKEMEEVITWLRSNMSHAVYQFFQVDNPNDLLACYKACYKAIEDIKALGLDHEEIVTDPTGGTKLMSAALILAAAELGLQVVYVGGETRTKDGKGIVINGTEILFKSAHPFDIIARDEKERFCRDFNTYRFEAALDSCRRIIDKGGDRLKTLFVALTKITEGYRDWDLFRYDTCTYSLEKGLDILRRLSAEDTLVAEKLGMFIRQVANNLEHLRGLPKLKYTWDYVHELVANACRRAEEGKYDDAVARLYRTVEMITQAEFMKLYGQGTSNFPVDKLDENTKNQIKHKAKEDKTVDLGSYDAYTHLANISNDLGLKYMTKADEIKAILQQRNNSILAHGIIPLSKSKFDDLLHIYKGLFGTDFDTIKFAKIKSKELFPIGIDLTV